MKKPSIDAELRRPPPAADSVAWAARLARGLIRRAARQAPGSLAERLDEEWLADLAERQGAWLRLRFALGCCWASRMITADYVGAAASVASAASHPSITLRNGPFFFPRRSIVLLLIIALHVVLICGLVKGLGSVVKGVIPPAMEATIKEADQPRVLPPPLPQPRDLWKRRPVDVPTPEIPIGGATEGEDTIRVDPAQPAPRPVPPPTVNRVQGGAGRGFPNAEDFYPAGAIRLGETGTATVRVCIDPIGRLNSAPVLAQSTGSVRLDDGALRLAQAGSGHYRPTMENGQPVSSCYPFRITFSLRQ